MILKFGQIFGIMLQDQSNNSRCLLRVGLKGKYHENLMSFQNPKMSVYEQKQKIIV